MKKANYFKVMSITLIGLWLTVFAIVPNCLIIFASFLSHNQQHLLKLPFTFENYHQIFQISYAKVFLQSFWVASIVTAFCLFIGYPFAYLLACTTPRYQTLLLLLIMIPFWMSSLVRTYAIMILLKAKGLINSLLIWMGIIHHPLQLLYSTPAMIIGLIYSLLPFMILPLYASIEKLDDTLIEAARNLGASKTKVFWRIIIPLTKPGIIAGILLVFLPAMTLFYIPEILGGAKSLLLGNLIENEFLQITNWPLGSTMSTLLLLLMAILLLLFWKTIKTSSEELT